MRWFPATHSAKGFCFNNEFVHNIFTSKYSQLHTSSGIFNRLNLQMRCSLFVLFFFRHTRCDLSVLFCRTLLTSGWLSQADYQWKSPLQLLYFPSNQCGEQQDVIDNDIEIDCLNPIPQFKVPKQIVYIHAIQCRDRTWQELPIDK